MSAARASSTTSSSDCARCSPRRRTTCERPVVSDGSSGPLWWAGLPTGATRDPLTQDESVDVAIVGAGFTGLWAGYYLLEADPSLKGARGSPRRGTTWARRV